MVVLYGTRSGVGSAIFGHDSENDHLADWLRDRCYRYSPPHCGMMAPCRPEGNDGRLDIRHNQVLITMPENSKLSSGTQPR